VKYQEETSSNWIFVCNMSSVCWTQVMGFSAEHVSGFVAMIGILSMMAQVGWLVHYTPHSSDVSVLDVIFQL